LSTPNYKISPALLAALKFLDYTFRPESDTRHAGIYNEYMITFHQTSHNRWIMMKNRDNILRDLLLAHNENVVEFNDLEAFVQEES
jgi:hypothetical protein